MSAAHLADRSARVGATASILTRRPRSSRRRCTEKSRMQALLRDLRHPSASSVIHFLALQPQGCGQSESRRKTQPLPGKLVDGRPCADHDGERARLAGRNRQPWALTHACRSVSRECRKQASTAPPRRPIVWPQYQFGVADNGRVSEKGEGRHRRARRHRRRIGRPSPDRARLGRHRRHRQVRHPDRHRLDGACLRLLLHDQP